MILYHGTRAGFRGRGGLLLPSSETGVETHEVSSPAWVYVTTDRETTIGFGRVARGRGRIRLLVVTPLEGLEPDPANDLEDSYRCSAAIVESVEVVRDPLAAPTRP